MPADEEAYEEEVFEDESPDLGPDERDRDLMDGSWEARYYAGRDRARDWNAVGIGVALILLVAFLLPMFLVFVD